MSIAEQIKSAFDPYYNAPLSVWNYYAEKGTIIQTKKDSILKSCNTIEKYSYFILKGSGGIFLWNKNNPICIDLFFEGDFFCDYLSFLHQKPTLLELMTFEECVLFRIPRPQFEDLSYISKVSNK